MTCILAKSYRLQSRRKFAQFMHRPPLGIYSGISHLPSLAEIPAFLLVVSIPSITLFHFISSLSLKSLHGSAHRIRRSVGAASSLAVCGSVGSGGFVRHSTPGSGSSEQSRLAGSRGRCPYHASIVNRSSNAVICGRNGLPSGREGSGSPVSSKCLSAAASEGRQVKACSAVKRPLRTASMMAVA